MSEFNASLLRDATHLAEYAARHGQLPADSRVFEAIVAVRANPADHARLFQEMDAIARELGPATLRRVTLQRLAADTIGRLLRRGKLLAIGLLTLVLTIYLIFQSIQLHEADTALRAYNDWVAQQPREKLYAAFKMYRYERVLSLATPPLAQLDAYQKLVDEANRLANKGDAIQGLLQQAHTLQYVPRVLQRLIPDTFHPLFAQVNGVPLLFEAAKKDGKDPNGAPASNGDEFMRLPDLAKLKPVDQAASLVPPPTTSHVRCEKVARPVPVKAPMPRTPVPSTEEMENYVNGWLCFLDRLKLDEHRVNYSPWPVIYETQLKINLLVTWLLPALYGALGACVFLMRGMLLTGGTAETEANILLSLMLRVALGGVAGIIIGWFWVPTPGVQISSVPFGMAFLAGFSIETLFSLLDRLNRTIENRDLTPATDQSRSLSK
jgi:hypothetical protein